MTDETIKHLHALREAAPIGIIAQSTGDAHAAIDKDCSRFYSAIHAELPALLEAVEIADALAEQNLSMNDALVKHAKFIMQLRKTFGLAVENNATEAMLGDARAERWALAEIEKLEKQLDDDEHPIDWEARSKAADEILLIAAASLGSAIETLPGLRTDEAALFLKQIQDHLGTKPR
jgi:hypothetical protein